MVRFPFITLASTPRQPVPAQLQALEVRRRETGIEIASERLSAVILA